MLRGGMGSRRLNTVLLKIHLGFHVCQAWTALTWSPLAGRAASLEQLSGPAEVAHIPADPAAGGKSYNSWPAIGLVRTAQFKSGDSERGRPRRPRRLRAGLTGTFQCDSAEPGVQDSTTTLRIRIGQAWTAAAAQPASLLSEDH
jgi:hypothetical protein